MLPVPIPDQRNRHYVLEPLPPGEAQQLKETEITPETLQKLAPGLTGKK
jgi:hypothetical protein